MEFPDPVVCKSDTIVSLKMRRMSPSSTPWSVDLTYITENSKRRKFNGVYQLMGETIGVEVSPLLSILQFLSEEEIKEGATLVLLNCNLAIDQLLLIRKYFPLKIDYWKVRGQNIKSCSEDITIRMGFPSKTTYSGINTYLYSDICSVIGSLMLSDLATQRKICIATKPIAASLRFRPPFAKNLLEEEEYEYFDGDLRTICLSHPTSIACRLIVRDVTKTKMYNLKDYEEQINYYNVEMRQRDSWMFEGERKTFDEFYCNHILSKISDDLNLSSLY